MARAAGISVYTVRDRCMFGGVKKRRWTGEQLTVPYTIIAGTRAALETGVDRNGHGSRDWHTQLSATWVL
jgi:hypothetical protein